jgi:hypothetical protein
MEKIILEAARMGHTGGNLCTSGVALEIELEENISKYKNKNDDELLKIDPSTEKLITIK